MKYQVCIRSQKSVGGTANTYGGPDTYFAVLSIPEGAEAPLALNRRVLARRGIRIRFFGEGYSRNRGPRSAYGQALAAAQSWADRQTAGQQQLRENLEGTYPVQLA